MALITRSITEVLNTLRPSPLEPMLTGPLLYLLTRDESKLRERLGAALAEYAWAPALPTVLKALKWLFALGLVGKLTVLLNKWAFNNWQVTAQNGEPYNWPTETVVVTGGSSGIGLRVAEILAGKGATVAIVDVQAPIRAIKTGRTKYYQCDITVHEKVRAVAARIKGELGAPSVLVNNAGVGANTPILDISDAALDRIFQVNLKCHWYTVQAFLPDMITARKGHVVTVASMASFVCLAGIVDYCATKAGALAFHEGLTQELKHRYNAPFVKTTVVHPHWVNTPLIAKGPNGEDREAQVKTMGAMGVDAVAVPICDNILNARSGQLIIPPKLTRVSGMRGWATFLQEFVRDRSSRITSQVK